MWSSQKRVSKYHEFAARTNRHNGEGTIGFKEEYERHRRAAPSFKEVLIESKSAKENVGNFFKPA